MYQPWVRGSCNRIDGVSPPLRELAHIMNGASPPTTVWIEAEATARAVSGVLVMAWEKMPFSVSAVVTVIPTALGLASHVAVSAQLARGASVDVATWHTNCDRSAWLIWAMERA